MQSLSPRRRLRRPLPFLSLAGASALQRIQLVRSSVRSDRALLVDSFPCSQNVESCMERQDHLCLGEGPLASHLMLSAAEAMLLLPASSSAVGVLTSISTLCPFACSALDAAVPFSKSTLPEALTRPTKHAKDQMRSLRDSVCDVSQALWAQYRPLKRGALLQSVKALQMDLWQAGLCLTHPHQSWHSWRLPCIEPVGSTVAGTVEYPAGLAGPEQTYLSVSMYS